MTNQEADIQILEISIRVLTSALDELLIECMDEKKRPVAPSKQALAQARGYMPKKYKSSYQYKEQT